MGFLIVLIIVICGSRIWYDSHKKEQFLADPERGRREMEYEQAKSQAKREKVLGAGALLWKLLAARR